LAMLLAVELRRSGTSLAKHRGINQTRELRRSGTSLAKHRGITQPMSSVGAAHR
jgi:hypothetical protein